MNRADLVRALEHKNVRAFLKAIRLGEGTDDGDAGFYRIVGGQMFTDDSVHPRVKVWIPRYSVYSTAAGAYQIIWPTWQGLCRQYGFTDFTPETQDEAAVALIAEKHALEDVMFGELERAIERCASIWASLPGSTSGQRQEQYEAVEAAYMAAGGVLA
jgi:muramidase (phage lysozyme)